MGKHNRYSSEVRQAIAYAREEAQRGRPQGGRQAAVRRPMGCRSRSERSSRRGIGTSAGIRYGVGVPLVLGAIYTGARWALLSRRVRASVSER